MHIVDALRVGASTIRLQRSQWRSAAQIRTYQQAQLARTLAFARKHVPFYRTRGISARSLPSSNWLDEFPVLTKRDLQESRDYLIADSARILRLHESRTSGSSGEPTTSYFDHSTWLFCKYALKARRMLSCGLGPGTRVLIVSESDEKALRSQRKAVLPGHGRLFQQLYVSLHAPLESHLHDLEQLRPHAIYAFPSYLSELLDYCELRDVKLQPVKVVFTSSELLTAALRTRLNVQFGARVCDIYGCTEFKEIAWQCEFGTYHVNYESVWIETLANSATDAPGELLLTTLVNRAAPLIRYRVGDLGTLDWRNCACGRQGPVLGELAGREVEMLELPDGRRLSPYLLTTAVENVEGLRQYQFIQTEGDCLDLRFTAEADRSPNPVELKRKLHEILGRDLNIRISKVTRIPRTPGGKRRLFVREAD